MYVHLCKKLRSTLKIVTNTQVFLTHKDGDLPLVVDEPVGVLSLKLIDKLDEVAVTMLAMLGAQTCQLIFAVDIMDADLALHQLLHEKIIPQRDMLCARNVDMVTGDVQCRRVINMQPHAAETLTEAQL